MTGSSLVWTSSLDGEIGTGTSFTRNDLSTGIHAIILTATDSKTASGTDSIGITVNITAPSNVNATAGDGQVSISWGSVSGATSYNIYWSTSPGVTADTGTNISNVTSPYTHTGLTNGTTYYYVVTAVNNYGESGESNEVSATPIYIYAETTMLLGDWYFYFLIITMFDEYYYLTDIDDSINDQGAHYVIGLNRYDDIVLACYWPDSGYWALLDTGIIIDKFFVFYTDGDTILNNSCYYQISHSTDEWSQCFDLYGYKFKSSSSLSHNMLGQFEKSKEEIIDDEELRAAEIDKADLIDDTLKDKYYQLKQLVDPLE